MLLIVASVDLTKEFYTIDTASTLPGFYKVLSTMGIHLCKSKRSHHSTSIWKATMDFDVDTYYL